MKVGKDLSDPRPQCTPPMPTGHVPQCHIYTVLNTSKDSDPTTPWAACVNASPLFGEVVPHTQPDPPLVQHEAITTHPCSKASLLPSIPLVL